MAEALKRVQSESQEHLLKIRQMNRRLLRGEWAFEEKQDYCDHIEALYYLAERCMKMIRTLADHLIDHHEKNQQASVDDGEG